jgi:hypothetical protein
MQFERKISMFLGVFGSLALALIFSRCSPVAPSIHKAAYGTRTSPEEAKIAFIGSMTTVKSSLKGEALVVSEDDSEPTLSDEQIDEFKKSGSAVIDFKRTEPFNMVEIVVNVKLTDEQIKNRNLYTFEVILKPTAEAGQYLIVVKEDTDHAITEKVMKSLDSVTFSLRNHTASLKKGTSVTSFDMTSQKLLMRPARYAFYF